VTRLYVVRELEFGASKESHLLTADDFGPRPHLLTTKEKEMAIR
jgi:hypothetical protein